MWFKLSLLLLLIFCSCNVSSKNLRKSLNQKVDGYDFMEDSVYPNAAPDVKLHDGLYNGYGGEAQGKQHHVSIDDSSNLNSHIGKKNGHKFDGSNFDEQHKDVLAEIQQIGYSGNKETPAGAPAMKNDDSVSYNGKFGKQKHERFRRGYYDWDTTTTFKPIVSDGEAAGIGVTVILLGIVLPILICCCVSGLIAWCIYSSLKKNREREEPGMVYQEQIEVVQQQNDVSAFIFFVQ
uniref:Uncharacterized protein n=1 Tax=Panagrolaimus davidi TaxID=227884 RepID=A0A914PQC6_9BILA